jgi:hypothetical protein
MQWINRRRDYKTCIHDYYAEYPLTNLPNQSSMLKNFLSENLITIKSISDWMRDIEEQYKKVAWNCPYSGESSVPGVDQKSAIVRCLFLQYPGMFFLKLIGLIANIGIIVSIKVSGLIRRMFPLL